MPNPFKPKTDPVPPLAYQIRLEGHLDAQWAEWFEGLTLTLEADGTTLLTGPLVDQAALHGVLKRVRDLGIPLVSVGRVPAGPADSYSHKEETGVGGLFPPNQPQLGEEK